LKQIIKKLVFLINEGVHLKEGTPVRAVSSKAYIQKIKRWQYRVNIFLEENVDTKAAMEFTINTESLSSDDWLGIDDGISSSLDSGIAVLQSIKDDFEQNPEFWLNRLSKNENTQEISTQSRMDSIGIVRNICSRFHIVATQLKDRRHENRNTITIADEYDVQDLLHALLKLYFDDVRPEEYTPSYAGGSSRIDFLLKNEKIAIETKKTRKGLKSKEIADQLIIDIDRYKEIHPDCEILFCFVYDPESLIQNPKGFESDFNKKHRCAEVLICPKGI